LGGAVPLFWGWGSHNRHGPKIGGSAPFCEGGAGSPSNTKSPGPRPTSIPSGILIHPAIWLQQIWAENWGLCRFGEGSWVSSNTVLLTLDISAAFDVVSHAILCKRIELDFGVTGAALSSVKSSCVGSYAVHVAVGSEKSRTCTLSSGVPQGSVLGPLLFAMCVSEIHCESKKRVPP